MKSSSFSGSAPGCCTGEAGMSESAGRSMSGGRPFFTAHYGFVPTHTPAVVGILLVNELRYGSRLKELLPSVLPVLQVHLHEYRQVPGIGKEARMPGHATHHGCTLVMNSALYQGVVSKVIIRFSGGNPPFPVFFPGVGIRGF